MFPGSKAELSNFKGAIQDYTKVTKLEPENFKAYTNREFTKMLLEDIKGACLDWSKAGESGSTEAYELIREYCN